MTSIGWGTGRTGTANLHGVCHEEVPTCPLCMEDLDETDRDFFPCPCDYQVCLWCLEYLKGNMSGKCPACRQPYDESRYRYLQSRRAEPVRKPVRTSKHSPKDGKSTALAASDSSRKDAGQSNLRDVRVIQRNLVYVVGLPPSIARSEDLRTREFFGRYGKVSNLVVTRTQTSAASYAAYVTYSTNGEAIDAIRDVDGAVYECRVLRAAFGTTKYCSYFLRGLNCTKADCFYLHTMGEECDRFTREQMVNSRATLIHLAVPKADDLALQDGGTSIYRLIVKSRGQPSKESQFGKPIPSSILREAEATTTDTSLPDSGPSQTNPDAARIGPSRPGCHRGLEKSTSPRGSSPVHEDDISRTEVISPTATGRGGKSKPTEGDQPHSWKPSGQPPADNGDSMATDASNARDVNKSNSRASTSFDLGETSTESASSATQNISQPPPNVCRKSSPNTAPSSRSASQVSLRSRTWCADEQSSCAGHQPACGDGVAEQRDALATPQDLPEVSCGVEVSPDAIRRDNAEMANSVHGPAHPTIECSFRQDGSSCARGQQIDPTAADPPAIPPTEGNFAVGASSGTAGGDCRKTSVSSPPVSEGPSGGAPSGGVPQEPSGARAKCPQNGFKELGSISAGFDLQGSAASAGSARFPPVDCLPHGSDVFPSGAASSGLCAPLDRKRDDTSMGAWAFAGGSGGFGGSNLARDPYSFVSSVSSEADHLQCPPKAPPEIPYPAAPMMEQDSVNGPFLLPSNPRHSHQFRSPSLPEGVEMAAPFLAPRFDCDLRCAVAPGGRQTLDAATLAELRAHARLTETRIHSQIDARIQELLLLGHREAALRVNAERSVIVPAILRERLAVLIAKLDGAMHPGLPVGMPLQPPELLGYPPLVNGSHASHFGPPRSLPSYLSDDLSMMRSGQPCEQDEEAMRLDLANCEGSLLGRALRNGHLRKSEASAAPPPATENQQRPLCHRSAQNPQPSSASSSQSSPSYGGSSHPSGPRDVGLQLLRSILPNANITLASHSSIYEENAAQQTSGFERTPQFVSHQQAHSPPYPVQIGSSIVQTELHHTAGPNPWRQAPQAWQPPYDRPPDQDIY